jgi:hypothetical protein
MKRLALILTLILAFTATSAFAGGKSCDAKHAAKSVSLTGTIATNADGTKIFRVADTGKTLTICHKSAESALKAGENGATVWVKGKVVSCDESEGEELMIETAKRV